MSDKTTVPDLNSLPGLKLRKARTDLSISIEEVSTSLGLTERSLKALEADDYDKLPSPVYIRGYIRRYCALLNINDASVLQDFELLIEGDEQQSKEQHQTPLLVNPQIRLAILCGVVLILLISAVAALAGETDEYYRTPAVISDTTPGAD